MIQITNDITIDEREIEEHFIRASGPGGQKVNKVSSAVQIRFDAARSPSLPDEVRERLLRLAGRRITEGGILIITARRFRTQDRNRQDALCRLIELIRKAAEKSKPHRKTRPTAASKRQRIESKHRRGEIKKMRRPVRNSDE